MINDYDKFADKYGAVYADNGYYQFAVTKASSRTAYEYKTSTKTQKPSLYIYEQYQLDSDDRDITINCSSQITTYYKPATNRVGGSNVQVPIEVTDERSQALALRWLVNYAKTRNGNGMAMNLANEIMDAANGVGGAVKKREDTHKMAEANKAFAHFRW